MTDTPANNLDTLLLRFREAAEIEHRLIDLERFVRNSIVADLVSVERWIARFTRLMKIRPGLAPYRKDIFAYLIAVHNRAIQQKKDVA